MPNMSTKSASIEGLKELKTVDKMTKAVGIRCMKEKIIDGCREYCPFIFWFWHF